MFTWPTYINSILQICHLVPYACTYVEAAASMGKSGGRWRRAVKRLAGSSAQWLKGGAGSYLKE